MSRHAGLELKSLQDALREEPRRALLSYLIRQKAERDIAAAGKASAREMLCSHPPASPEAGAHCSA